MSHIHFIGGEKGGVGKSTVARLLVQYCIDHKRNFTVLDADQSHGEMLRFYAEYSEPVVLDDAEDADRIFEVAEDRGQNVIVDLPSQSQRQLKRWLDEGGILELAMEQAVTVIFWHVLDGGKDGIRLLEHALDEYGDHDNVHFVIVKNQGMSEDFSYFDQSEVSARARRSGARFLVLPMLNRKVMNRIDHMDLSFWAAVNRTSGDALGRMERQRVRVWRDGWYEQLAQIEQWLSPTRDAAIQRLNISEPTVPAPELTLAHFNQAL